MAVNEPMSKALAINATNGLKASLRLTRWHGAQHPSRQNITRQMQQEGLRPYAWSIGPNCRITARSNGYTKVMYCVEGSIELFLPDVSQSIVLRPGDRVDIPPRVRHSAIVGPHGASCVESELYNN